ncbi:helix-turn-helix transcriptional regulator [Salana multivorans]
MRAERMIATLLLMQARGRVTASELASELEVSVATARRDLEALARSGVPVYPQPGRGGGWSLVGGARTDLSGLTAPEAQALFTLLGSATSSSSSSGTVASPEIVSAVRKLLRALPGPFRDDAAAAAAAIHRDGVGWGELAARRPETVDIVRQAVVARVRVRLDYVNGAGEPSSPVVSPLGMVAKDDRWYLLAARDAERVRTYRMDRVHAVVVLDEPAERPDGFDLAREWGKVVDHVEAQRSLVTARLRVPAEHLWVLREHFGRYLDVMADGGEGQPDVMVAAHTARSIAEHLAGWGGTVQVVGPEEVRRELAVIGAELVASYRTVEEVMP